MKLTRLLLALPMVIALCVTACKEIPPGDYDSSEVGKIKKVVPGVIISMRPVRLHNKNAEIGLTSSSASKAAVDDSPVNRSHGFEYVIKLQSGGIISVVQAENIKLKIKQHILVIYGQHTRVVADNGSDDF